MIQDARALRPDAVPQELYHRDGKIDHLSTVLAPGELSWADNVCLFGPSGTGKTTIAKYTLGQLERQRLGIRWAYVNCLSETTRAGVLYNAARQVGLGADLRRQGSPGTKVIQRLREYDDQIVVVLDEVSVVDEAALLAFEPLEQVSLICITTEEDEWFAELSSRTTSRLRSAAMIHLEKYTHEELCDILASRVDHGLDTSKVSDDLVPYIADRAAGNARLGIALLRRGVQAVRRGDEWDEVTPAVIDATADAARQDIRDHREANLGTHHQLLYDIIREASEIDAETLAARYERRAHNPKSDSSRRRYLKVLRKYELIERVGTTRATRYRVLGDA